MKLDKTKFDLILARKQMTLLDLKNSGVCLASLNKAQKGLNIRPITMGGIAAALGVDVGEIILREDE